MNILLQFSPNNEVRLSLQSLNTPHRQRGDSAGSRELAKYANLAMASQVEVARGFSMSALLHTGGTPNNVIVSHTEADATEVVKSRSLDFLNEVQQATKKQRESRKNAIKPGYGGFARPSRFGRNARRRIISAGSILEKRGKNPSQGVLVTCTLPGDSPSAIREFGKWSGYVINRAFQRVRAVIYASRSWRPSQISWFYCWELQTRGALHVHTCLWSNEPAFSEYLGHVFKAGWEDAIKDISARGESDLCTKRNGRSCWLPQYWQNDVQIIRQSVARYVSKYVSKDKTKPACWDGARVYPTRWWGMDRVLNQEVRRQSPELKARSLSESRAVGLFALLSREIAEMGVCLQYSWNADIGNNGYHAGWVHCSGFYLNADIFISAKEWLLEFMARCIADIDYSCIEYRNYEPLPSYLSEVANRLLEV